MSSDASPDLVTSDDSAPAASLASVSLSRQAGGAARRKRGDITERLMPGTPSPHAEASMPVKPRNSDDIVDYWDNLRGDRAFPRPDDLDRLLITQSWPNSLILAFGADANAMPRITRLGDTDGTVDYTAMVTDWLLSRGREAVRSGEALEDDQRFPLSSGGSARYHLLLLPVGADEAKADQVLCHLTRVEEAPSVKTTFKRWFAS